MIISAIAWPLALVCAAAIVCLCTVICFSIVVREADAEFVKSWQGALEDLKRRVRDLESRGPSRS